MWLVRILRGKGRFKGHDNTPLDHLWLRKLPLTVGRNVESQEGAVLFGDPAISREHAFLYLSGGLLRIRNVSRTNPIWVDGTCVEHRGHLALRSGQVCQVGRTLLVFEEAAADAEVPAAAHAHATSSLARPAAGRPLSAGPLSNRFVIVVFDTVGGTSIRDRHGDDPIDEWVTFLQHRSRELRRVYIRGTGDGAFVLFEDVQPAATLAFNVMRFVTARNRASRAQEHVHVRCGMHYGEVHPHLLSGYTGLSLDFAYRITEASPEAGLRIPVRGIDPGRLRNEDRIWYSDVIDQMGVGEQWPHRKLGWFDLRHITGLHTLHELLWQDIQPEDLATPLHEDGVP